MFSCMDNCAVELSAGRKRQIYTGHVDSHSPVLIVYRWCNTMKHFCIGCDENKGLHSARYRLTRFIAFIDLVILCGLQTSLYYTRSISTNRETHKAQGSSELAVHPQWQLQLVNKHSGIKIRHSNHLCFITRQYLYILTDKHLKKAESD